MSKTMKKKIVKQNSPFYDRSVQVTSTTSTCFFSVFSLKILRHKSPDSVNTKSATIDQSLVYSVLIIICWSPCALFAVLSRLAVINAQSLVGT